MIDSTLTNSRLNAKDKGQSKVTSLLKFEYFKDKKRNQFGPPTLGVEHWRACVVDCEGLD